MSQVIIDISTRVSRNLLGGAKKKPAANPTNWKFSATTYSKKTTEAKLPDICSLKDKFPKCYNQFYNNCTSNAVLACDAFYYHDPKGTWVPSTVFTYYNQRKMDEALKDPDEGSTVETALDAVRKYGACSAGVWPNCNSYRTKPSKEAYADGLKGHEITKYYNVKSLLQIKKALANGYPVVCSVAWAFRTFDDSTYILGDVSGSEGEHCDLGHAIVIVGYDEERKIFEIRNSWGESWCNKGYAYVTYDSMKNVIWWDDAYAVIK